MVKRTDEAKTSAAIDAARVVRFEWVVTMDIRTLWQNSVRQLLARYNLCKPPQPRITTIQELNRWFRGQSPTAVLSGPFEGMLYGERSFESMHLPKLLGTYERELGRYFTAENLRRYSWFVNWGCAEGYYANGIAFVLKSSGFALPAPILAIDRNEEALAEGKRIASWNALDVQFVNDFPPGFNVHLRGQILVVCDVDGAEVDLLVPSLLPPLDRTDLIVELHDPPGTSAILDTLRERFSSSHECNVVEFQPRQPWHFPKRLRLAMDETLKLEAMDERRIRSFRWLILSSRSVCQN